MEYVFEDLVKNNFMSSASLYFNPHPVKHVRSYSARLCYLLTFATKTKPENVKRFNYESQYNCMT